MDTPIQHIIVLMLENRSFDHMLGYLEYPPEAGFTGLRGHENSYPNLLANGQTTNPGPGADYLIDPGPEHSHASAMRQLFGAQAQKPPYHPANNGFALDYETIAPGQGKVALQCFPPDCLPVLSTLAKEFAVCDHWFCSVPGETWPNRNFVHSATSDGEVNITLRAYANRTIYEQLSEAGKDWAIYYGGFPPQSIAFDQVWSNHRQRIQRYKPIDNLYRAIQSGHLPQYAFVEPDMLGKISDSQHPGMGGREDFMAGERLIWSIYDSLRQNPAVFNRTLFLITYDEHGGLFDHVAPPSGEEWKVSPPHRDSQGNVDFPFDLLGVRVPAVLVSPWIAAGTVDHTIYDHTSVIATVRKLLGGPDVALTERDAHANTFERLVNLPSPRLDLPVIPQPFVDDALRKIMPGVPLRDSLTWILKDMIWASLEASGPTPIPATGTAAQPGETALASAMMMGQPGGSWLAQKSAELVNEIGPKLSLKAQGILLEEEAVTGVIGLFTRLSPSIGFSTWLGMMRTKLERMLEQEDLVDDAQVIGAWLFHQFELPVISLHRLGGDTVDDPSPADYQKALDTLFAQQDPQASIWLADHVDRWLDIQADGTARFYDRHPEKVGSISSVDRSKAMLMMGLFHSGDFAGLKKFISS